MARSRASALRTLTPCSFATGAQQFMTLSSTICIHSLEKACAKSTHRLGVNEIVGPEAALLTSDQALLQQELQVMRDGRLLDRQTGFEVADADLAAVTRQQVDQVHTNRVRQDVEV